MALAWTKRGGGASLAVMCNHFRANPEAIPTWAEYAGYRLPAGVIEQASGDAWPKRPALVVRTIDGEPTVTALSWGVPRTMPGKRPGTTITKAVTNVRNLDSGFWRSMLREPERRCLVPFTQFAEPVIGGGRAEHWFATERPVACFAGIWRPSAAGEVFAFLTCTPNPLVAPLHPKAMPVILAAEDEAAWLAGADAAALQSPYPSQLMTVS